MNVKDKTIQQEPDEGLAFKKHIKAHYSNTNSGLKAQEATFITWQGKRWMKIICLTLVVCLFSLQSAWAGQYTRDDTLMNNLMKGDSFGEAFTGFAITIGSRFLAPGLDNAFGPIAGNAIIGGLEGGAMAGLSGGNIGKGMLYGSAGGALSGGISKFGVNSLPGYLAKYGSMGAIRGASLSAAAEGNIGKGALYGGGAGLIYGGLNYRNYRISSSTLNSGTNNIGSSKHSFQSSPQLATTSQSSHFDKRMGGDFATASIAPTSTSGIENIASSTSSQSSWSYLTKGLANMRNAIAVQQVGSTFAKLGTVCWGMSPEGAQFLGMVTGSVTHGTMQAIDNPDSIRRMYGAEKTNIQTTNTSADTSGNDWQGGWNFANKHPVLAGAITGLGQGAIQAGINLGIQESLGDSVPDTIKFRLANLGGTTLSSLAWAGIADLTMGDGNLGRLVNPNEISLRNEKGGLQLREYIKYSPYLRGTVSQALSTGIEWVTTGARETGKRKYAYDISSSGTMLLTNLAGLREPIAITPSRNLDKVLEPLIYGAMSSGVTAFNARYQDKSADRQACANLAAFLAANEASSALHTTLTRGNQQAFNRTFSEKVAGLSEDIIGFGATAGIKALENGVSDSSIYTTTLMNNKNWNFAGLTSLAWQADKIREDEGNWRAWTYLPDTPAALTNYTSNLLGYHAVMNLEELNYTAVKKAFPYGLSRSKPDFANWLATSEPAVLAKINQWVRNSAYPLQRYDELGKERLSKTQESGLPVLEQFEIGPWRISYSEANSERGKPLSLEYYYEKEKYYDAPLKSFKPRLDLLDLKDQYKGRR